jgi:hypothetical protein
MARPAWRERRPSDDLGSRKEHPCTRCHITTTDLMKNPPPPRAGLAVSHQNRTDGAPYKPVADPAEHLAPSQPLKDGLLLPDLAQPPKASRMTPEAPSKSPQEELKETQRQIDRRLREDNNNKHAYAGVNDCFTHLRVLLVLQTPRHFGPRN